MCLVQIGEVRADIKPASGYCNDAKTCLWNLDTNGVLTISAKEGAKNVAIKDYAYVSGYDVDSYPAGVKTTAPWGGLGATSLVIRDNITSIGRDAFVGESKITNISGMNSVKTLGPQCFDWMTGVTELTIPSSVTELQSQALSFMKGLKSLTIPASVTTVAATSFYSTNGIEELIISDNLNTKNWNLEAFNVAGRANFLSNLTIRCLGDTAKCQAAMAKYLPAPQGTCTSNYCIQEVVIAPATETQCNGSGKYYYTGSTCDKIPTDLSKMTCNSGYVLDETAHRCNKIAGCASFADGACTCDEGYYTKAGGCVSADEGCGKYYYKKQTNCVPFEEGCGEGWLEKDSECIEASEGCGDGYKDLGGWCNRVQYTPAEAATLLTDENNTVTITFRK